MKITVEGHQVTVDDSFKHLTPEEQEATVEEIARELNVKPSAQPAEPAAPQDPDMAELSNLTQTADPGTLARAEYDALPGWKKPLVATSDILSQVGRAPVAMATGAYGLATRGKGYTPEEAIAGAKSSILGMDYDEELKRQQAQQAAIEARSGAAGTAAEVAGTAMLPMGSGLRAAVPLGAAYGGLGAAGNGGDPITGAIAGAGGGALGVGAGKVINYGAQKLAGGAGRIADAVLGQATPSVLKTLPRAPLATPASVKAGAQAAFKEAADQGAIYNTKGITKLASDITSDLRGMSFHPVNEPGVMPVLQELQKIGRTGNVTLEGLHSLRRMAQNGYRPGMKSNNAAISKIVERIDDLVANADPAHVAALGNANLAGAAQAKGISEWNKFRKMETVEKLAERGEVMGSMLKGQDIAGRKRREVAKIFTNDRIGRYFNPTERKMAADVAQKGFKEQAADAVQGLIPTQGRLQGALAAGQFIHNLVTLNLPGLGLQAAGWGAGKLGKKIGEKSADAAIEKFAQYVATGKVSTKQATNLLQSATAAQRKAFQKALARAGVSTSSLLPAVTLQTDDQ